MHSLSFLSSERNWKLRAASISVLTRIKEEDGGTQHFIYQQISWVIATSGREEPKVQLPPDQTNQTEIRDFFLNLLESLPAMTYAERLEKLVKLIKKGREWEGSTRAALKDGEGFLKRRQILHKVTVYFTSLCNEGMNNRQAFRTYALSVFCFSTYAEDNRDALYEQQCQLDSRSSPMTEV